MMQSLPPDLTPEQLAALAAQDPSQWQAIYHHPNAYPQLREWIQQQVTAQGVQQPVASQTGMPIGYGEAGDERAISPQYGASNGKRSTPWIVVAVVALVAALIGLSVWLFASGGDRDDEDAQATASPSAFSSPAFALPAGAPAACVAPELPHAYAELSDTWVIVCRNDQGQVSQMRYLPKDAAASWSQLQSTSVTEVSDGQSFNGLTTDGRFQIVLDYGNNRVQLGQPGQNQLLIDGQPLRVAVEGLPEKTSESTLSGDYQVAITQQEEDAKREEGASQLKGFTSLIDEVKRGREFARKAAKQVGSQNYSSAYESYNAAYESRTAVLNQIDSYSLDQVENGQEIKDSLREAMEASLEGNSAQMDWTAGCIDGMKCKKPTSVTDLEGASDTPKERFVTEWDTAAKQYGVDTRYKAADL